MMKLVISLILFGLIKCDKPNVIVIVADDLGFNDVSFRGSSEIPTPNIDALCYNGVILNRMYTTPLCTPSRSSIMTGKYVTKLGMQHYVIPSDEPWALPKNEKIISEYFKEAGYRTALVGKWHLGFYKKHYTPTFRGFDYHYGYLGPYISYYDHDLKMFDRNYSRGYDMRRNLEIAQKTKKYVTDVFTDEAVNLIKNHDGNEPLFMMLMHLAPHTGNEDNPMEAPDEIIEKFNHIKSEKRRKLAAMISVMDVGIGKVVKAIKDKGILENTIVMFLSDNGGPTVGVHSNEASNYPLRGQKIGIFEGGCRVPACIYSPLIKSKRNIVNDFMHITDILPTLASVANISIRDHTLDGFDQWDVISNGHSSSRREILYNIDPVFGFGAVVNDGWKVVNGTENIKVSGWLGTAGSNTNVEGYIHSVLNSKVSKSLPPLNAELIKSMRNDARVICDKNQTATKCNPLESPCLFNIIDDPCEMNNLAKKHPAKLEFLLSRLKYHEFIMVPSLRKKYDPQCDPALHNFTWTWWQSDDGDDSADDDSHLMNIIVYTIFILLPVFIFCCIFFKLCTAKCGVKLSQKN